MSGNRSNLSAPSLKGSSVPSVSRIEGPAKVTGAARYPADVNLGSGTKYAVLSTATISVGRVVSIDATEALAVPGVRLVLDHTNMDALPAASGRYPLGPALSVFQPLQTDEIRYFGQPVAMLVADELETARYAASLLTIVYEERKEPPRATMEAEVERDGRSAILKVEGAPDHIFGDVENAYHLADVTIEAEYDTPIQHHNAIELYSTAACWNNDATELTIHEPTPRPAPKS